MNTKKLVEGLHQLEREILPVLDRYNDVNDIATFTNLQPAAVSRALKWLEKKELISIQEKEHELIHLDVNGKKYLEEGLPEKTLLKAIQKSELTINQVKKEAKLSNEELNVAIGRLRKHNTLFITKDRKLKILDGGKKLLRNGFPEEKFLQKEFPLEVSQVNEKKIYTELKKRKNILKVDMVKSKIITLTEAGKKLLESDIKISDTIDALSSSILKTGAWKGQKFRRFDIESKPPRIHIGKKQHYRYFLDQVRQKFMSLGFEEMSGPIVETNFWNMDALYMPQFHSARDIHDAYYVKEPKDTTNLPKAVVDKVKKAHESGFTTGSKGWQYDFDVKFTHRHILRTHDTSISPRTLASDSLKIPGKYFQIVRCFRYDVIDATHLADFNQTGGFVVADDLNFRHLKGLLKLFAEEFAETDQIKIVPGYFPFTEPSAELLAKHPELGWIELAGSGIFRPEMCKPLGVDAPVIAWGLGLERLAMFKLGLNDIRELFSHNLKFLRSVKVI